MRGALADALQACHLPGMANAHPRFILCVSLALSGCAGEKSCTPPRKAWTVSGAASDQLALDDQDRMIWNGKIISLERLRGTLNQADADGHTVRFTPSAGSGCDARETARIAMERSLSCETGRCAEAAASK